MGAEAVEVGFERFQLLHKGQRAFLCTTFHRRSPTSSDLVGFGVSSGFLTIFALRLSLLDGRVGLSASAALVDGRLAVGVPPLAALALAAMFAGCWELLAAFEDVIDDDEVFGRVAAGGVGDGLVLMVWRCRKRNNKKSH